MHVSGEDTGLAEAVDAQFVEMSCFGGIGGLIEIGSTAFAAIAVQGELVDEHSQFTQSARA